jgi:hypothetical protein
VLCRRASAPLKAAVKWTDFAAICSAVADELDTADGTDLPTVINRMLTGWLSEGVLVGAHA